MPAEYAQGVATFGPLFNFAVVIALVVYVWRRKERRVNEMEKRLEKTVTDKELSRVENRFEGYATVGELNACVDTLKRLDETWQKREEAIMKRLEDGNKEFRKVGERLAAIETLQEVLERQTK